MYFDGLVSGGVFFNIFQDENVRYGLIDYDGIPSGFGIISPSESVSLIHAVSDFS
jgi:hypothetical protein